MREGIVAAIVALFVVGCVWTAVDVGRRDVSGAKDQAAGALERLRADNAIELARLDAKIRSGQVLTETEITFLRQQFGQVVVVGGSTVVAPQSPPVAVSVLDDAAAPGIDWPALSFMAWAVGVEVDQLAVADRAYWDEIWRISRATMAVKGQLGTITQALSR